MSNGGKGGGSLPFIKRDQIRRDFLRARLKRSAPSKNALVKKEDPDMLDERARLMLNGGEGGRNVSVKQEDEYQVYPLRAANKQDLEKIKVHLLKFQSKKKVEPTKDFHLPIRLHRKDTRNVQFQLTRAEIVQRQKEIAEYKRRLESDKSGDATPGSAEVTSAPGSKEEQQVSPEPGVVGKDEEGDKVKKEDPTAKDESKAPGANTKLEEAGPAEDPSKVGLVKYDGKEQPVIDFQAGTTDPLADVAPDGGGRFRRGISKRKTRQLKLLDEKARSLRFEEFYPWVMEDFDGLNTWVGSYEAGNSDSYVFLSAENDGSFTMIPADKVYRFTARNKYATLTIEEAEKRMEKNGAGAPRWLMKHLDNIGTTTTRYDRTRRRLKAVDGNDRNDEEDRMDNSEVELDYDEEFADDEEAPIIDGNEEENKESEQRIKKEMLQANAMGLHDDDDIQGDDDLFGEKKIDEEGEKVKKALLKTDLGALYESDEDSNPYLSESDVDEEDESKVKKEEQDDSDLTKKSSPKKRASRSPLAGPRIFVKSIKNCVIVLNAEKSVLSSFPAGDWNPAAKNSSAEARDNENWPPVKQEGDNMLENDDLLTEQDIIDAVRGKEITLKHLIKELKGKISRHPENKARMKLYFKKLVKLNGEYLELVK